MGHRARTGRPSGQPLSRTRFRRIVTCGRSRTGGRSRRSREESVVRRPLLVLAGAVIGVVAAAAPAAGVPAQTPKRGGTLVIRVLGPEPACLNVLPMSCNEGGLASGPTRFCRCRSRSVPTSRTRKASSRGSTTRGRRPFTLTYHIRPEAHWSDGVPITAQDFIFTLRAIRRHAIPEVRDLHAPIRSARAVDSQDPASGSSAEVRELARLLREHPPGARASRFGSHAGLERPDRRSEDGSTHRKWPVPRRAARARPPARPPPQPPLLGAAPSLRRAARHQIRGGRLPIPARS